MCGTRRHRNSEHPRNGRIRILQTAKIAPGVVVICPIREMKVPVEITIWESEPQVIFDAWHHVIEAPLTTTGVRFMSAQVGHTLGSASRRATIRFADCIAAWTNYQMTDLKGKTLTRYKSGDPHVPVCE
jgi:hypothetical protein